MFKEKEFESLQNPYLNIAFYDNRTVGSVFGMTAFGLIGFVALGFSIFGALAGVIVGVVVGRYMGKQVKNNKQKNCSISNFEILEAKVECLLNWAKNSVFLE